MLQATLRGLAIAMLLGTPASAAEPAPQPQPAPALTCIAPLLEATALTSKECCKTCHKGKACGDTCISRKKTCHKPPGCACDG